MAPARLVVITTNLAGTEFVLDRPSLVIGRTPENDIVLNHKSISRHHAKVIRDGDKYIVVDLESANGVRVNGSEFERVELKSGDTLELGHVRLRFTSGADYVDFDIGEAGRSRRRLVFAGAGGAVVVAGFALAFAMRGGDLGSTEPAKAPVASAPVAGRVARSHAGADAADGRPALRARPDRPEGLIAQAKAAKAKESWDAALEAVKGALDLAPLSQEAVTLREAIESEQEASVRFAKIKEAAKANNHEEVLNLFGGIAESSIYRPRALSLRRTAQSRVIAVRLAEAQKFAAPRRMRPGPGGSRPGAGPRAGARRGSLGDRKMRTGRGPSDREAGARGAGGRSPRSRPPRTPPRRKRPPRWRARRASWPRAEAKEAKEIAAREQAAEGQDRRAARRPPQGAAERDAAREVAAKEQAAKDEAARLAREQAAKERRQAAKDERRNRRRQGTAPSKLAREQAAKDKAAKDEAAAWPASAAKEAAARRPPRTRPPATGPRSRPPRSKPRREAAARDKARRAKAAREAAASRPRRGDRLPRRRPPGGGRQAAAREPAERQHQRAAPAGREATSRPGLAEPRPASEPHSDSRPAATPPPRHAPAPRPPGQPPAARREPTGDPEALVQDAQQAWLRGQYMLAIDSARRALRSGPR